MSQTSSGSERSWFQVKFDGAKSGLAHLALDHDRLRSYPGRFRTRGEEEAFASLTVATARKSAPIKG